MEQVDTNITKKKILIVNNNLEVGGVQTSLLNLLNAIHDDYDIKLFLFCDKVSVSEEQLAKIPSNIRVQYAKGKLLGLGLSQAKSRKHSLLLGLIRGCCAFWSKKFSNSLPIRFLQQGYNIHPLLQKEYDVAISYLHGAGKHDLYGGCNEFVLRHVKAKRKITWVHCDYEHYQGNTKYNKRIVCKFDDVVACSNSVKNVLIDSFKKDGFNIEDKVHVVYNMVDTDKLLELADEYDPFADIENIDENTIKLITVARLSEEKGIPQAITAFAKRYPNAYNKNIQWFIIGGGKVNDEIAQVIRNNQLENIIHLVGEKKNPYPYFKHADMLLVTSNHEAAPMVFSEGAVFHLPILTTATTSSYELVQNLYRGIVFANVDNLIAFALSREVPVYDYCTELIENTGKEQFKQIIEGEITNDECN